MAVNTISWWKHLVVASASALALACGGDDDGGSNDNKGNEETTTGKVLDQGVVGKECAADTDCGKNGKCKTTQSVGGISDLLGAFGVNTALPAPGGYCTIACSDNAECGAGGVCFGAVGNLVPGECRKGCASSGDCRQGYECAKMQANADGGGLGQLQVLPAQCQALPPVMTLGANQAGAACSTEADAGVALNQACGAGTCAFGACTATCVDDSTCGAGAVCVPNGVYGGVGGCQETCAVDADCNQFATAAVGCIEVQGRKLCGPKQKPLAAGILGTACTADTQCGTGTCATTFGLLFNMTTAPGGYCTINNCQDDSVCTGGVCVGVPGLTRCYDSCSAPSDCRAGYACVDRMTSGMATSKVCAPAAADAGVPPAATTTSDAGV